MAKASSSIALVALALVLAGTAHAQDQPAKGGDAASSDAARQSQTVTFYGHVFGVGLDSPMPANTFAPRGDGLFAQGSSPDNCGVVPAEDPSGTVAPGGPDCDKDPLNKRVLFLTAGPVQVHTATDFNYTLLHNEHGRAKDVFLDTTKDLHAWFYAAADFHSWGLFCTGSDVQVVVVTVPGALPHDVPCPAPFWQWDPGVIPNFVVEAKLYAAELGDYGQGASEPPPIRAAIEGGKAKVIAEGHTAPLNLQTGLPGSPNAQEFDVNLGKVKVDVVPKNQDLFLVYSWYQDINGQKMLPSGFFAPSIKPWAGEQFPVRFTLPVKNPFDVELVIPQFIHGKMLIHGVLSSPWGSYDVDTKSVTLDVRDPNGAPAQLGHLVRSGDYSVAHGAHFKPVNITWVWDYTADKARPGTYKATVQGCDLERVCGSTEASFTINADGSPGDFTVGRSGQQTATEGQLKSITGAAPGQGNVTAKSAATSPTTMKQTPGLEPLAFGLAAVSVALLARRRKGS